MEVKGAGLQVWEPKAAGRDGGSEHISRIWGGSMSVVPAATPVPVGRHLPMCVPGYCAPPVLHTVGCTPPWWGGRGKCPWSNLQVGYCTSNGGTVDTPSLNLAKAERDPTLHHPQAALLPPSHREQAAYCSESPLLIGAGEGKESPGGGKEMAAEVGRRWPQRDVPSVRSRWLLTRGARAPVLGTG